MLSKQFHREKRKLLSKMLDKTILLMGCGNRSRNLPMNRLPFRQDSSFLYFTGCTIPHSALLIHNGESTLFLEEPHPSDILWHGPVPSFSDYAQFYGINIQPMSQLEEQCKKYDSIAGIAIADVLQNQRLEKIIRQPLSYGRENGDPELIDCIIQLRRILEPVEIDQISKTMETTKLAHLAAMRATVPGGTEAGRPWDEESPPGQ